MTENEEYNLPSNYGIKEIIQGRYYEIYKFDAHHGDISKTYIVKMSVGKWRCDCPANSNKCKHIAMVKNFQNPKKELF